MYKYLILSLFSISLSLFNTSNAQVTPDGILFQAVARDANGNGAVGRNVYAKVTIVKGTSTGNSVYQESFKVVSTNDGIFTLVIGKGTRISGATGLTAIVWNDALYFVNIKIAIEPTIPGPGWNAETEYVDMGTSQLWSVPYALFTSRATIADSALSISAIVPASKGGTGVDNGGKTITLAQNLFFKGVGDITITSTAASNVSLPTTGLLANTLYVSDRIGTDTVSLSNRINTLSVAAGSTNALKVNIADTALMLNPYLRKLDTASLSKRINIKLDSAQIPGIIAPYLVSIAGVKYADTAALLSPYAIRSNTVASIDAEKTRALAAELALDTRVTNNTTNITSNTASITANTTAITTEATAARAAEALKVNIADSATMLLPYAIRSNTVSSINTKINIADSAAMLLPYAIRSNTVSSINTKINITDSAAMLLPYAIRANTVASIDAEKTRALAAEALKINISDSAAMLLPYAIRSNTVASIDAEKTRALAAEALKINIADSATMLLPYAIRSNTIASIDAEKTRGLAAELALDTRVTTNTTNIASNTSSITANTTAINTEVTTARAAELVLTNNVYANTASITANTTAINTEATRALAAESLKINIADSAAMLLPYAIRANTVASIDAEKTRGLAAELALDTRVITNTTNIASNTSSITANTTAINTEATRALAAELALDTRVTTNTTNITSNTASITANTTAINTEATRALAAEALKINIADSAAMLLPYAIRSNTIASIDAEKTRSLAAELALDTRVTNNTTNIASNTSSITANTTAITTEALTARTAELTLDTKINANTASITTNTADIALRSTISSPSFTGVPLAPTAITGTSNTQIATTAFVNASITNTSTPDATTNTKGKIKLANDLGGTADLPTVNSVGGSSSSTINTATVLANAATAANTASTIVKRDVNGDFNAGTITANLLGTSTNVTGIVTGVNGGTGINNTGKTITLGGNINTGEAFTTTGTTGLNASAITFKTIAPTDLILPTTGTISTLSGTESLTNKTINGLTPTSLATGFSIAGGTINKTLTVNNTATVSGTNTGDQTISLTGDVTGSGNGSFTTTLANSGVTAGTYGSSTSVPTITVDVKGRVTNVANTTITGVSPVGSAMSSGKIIVGDASNIASIVDMSGDVTIDNTGATLVGSNKITTSKILNSNITYSKIQDVTSGKILGRSTIGNGIVEEIATTGTGDVVKAVSPTFTGVPQTPTPIVSSNDGTIANTQFVTRAIGNISASSVSGVLPGSNGGTGVDNTGKTITLGGNLTTSGNNSLTLTTTGATNVTLPTSGTLATTAQLDAIAGGSFSGGQITGIVAPANGGTGIANNNTVTLGGNLLTGAAFTTAGTTALNAASIKLRTTAASDVTLPTSGTLATLTGAETFTNKTIVAADNSISGLTNTNLSGAAGITDANLATISTAGKVLNTATSATSSNTVNAIVARDASGNFTANSITASLAGNAATATKLATARTIYGNSFDGTANLSQVIASNYGGTGNGFTKFTGATSAEKVYTLPDANATLLSTNALVTPTQGGTGVAVASANTIFAGPISGVDAAPGFRALTGADLPAGSGLYIANGTSQQASSNFNISGAGIAGESLTAGSFIKQTGTSAQFLKADGSVDARSFATLTGSESLTNKSINGITPTAVTTGFTLAGGSTNSKTLTVASDANVAGTNTGDVTLAVGENYLSIANQTITASAVNLSGTNVTGTLAAARFPALTGDITNTAGTVATTISANAVTNTKIADNAVTSTKVADNAISSAKIATSAVTLDKIASISVQKLLGNKSSTAASAPGEIAIGTGLALDATTGILSASGSGGTVTGTGTAGQLAYWSTTTGLGSNPNFTWDNTNKIAKIGEGVNHVDVDAYLNTNMSAMPAFSVIGKINSTTEQTLLRLKRVHNQGSSYAGQLDFASTGGASNLMRVDLRLNNANNDNYYNLLTLENQSGNVGINNITPTEKLDITGNLRFSGVLKPNNIAGTIGQYLTSQGASTAPTWTTFNGVTSIGSIAGTATANGATITSGVLNLAPADATIGGVLTNGAQSIGGNKRFFGLVTLNDNLQVNFSGGAGAGIVFTGDGDMVDNNDGYGTMRFTNGIKINNGNGSLGTTTNIILGGNGNITAAGTVEAVGLKITGGTPGAGKVLVSDANGLGSWASSSPASLSGGVAGAVVYQSGIGTTSFTAAGTSGQYLTSNGTTAPTWATVSNATASTNGFLTSTDWSTFNNKFALPALTSGSLLFSNGSTIAQNNANLFWDNTNARLGILTAAPTSMFQVGQDDISSDTYKYNTALSYDYNTSSQSGLLKFRYRGKEFRTKTETSSGVLYNLVQTYFDGTTETEAMRISNTGLVSIGSLSATNLKISGGTLAAGKVLVSDASGNATWANNSPTSLNGGVAGAMPYQSGVGTTSFTAAGTAGQILSSTGTTAPAWITTLPIANGGTGSATQNFVDLTTAQSIAGSKTFSSDILMGSARIGLGGGAGGSGGRNIAMGISALAANTTGQWNVALGAYNLQTATTASNNVAIGNEVMGVSAPGNDNTGVGNRALFYNTGANNTAIGSSALNANTSGAGNTALGISSGAIITTGTNNTFIGKDANANLLSRTNATALGYGAVVTADNTIQLGNTSVTTVNTSGAINAPVYSSTPVALTAGATITWTPLSGLNTSVTLTSNSTLAFGATPPAGSSGTLIVTQPATGGPYSLTLPTVSGKTNKVLGSASGILLSSAANAKDIVSFYYDGNDFYWNVGLGYGTTQNISANTISGGVAGALLYQTASNTTGFTAAGTAGQILTSTGTNAPAWVATLPIANGGTGSATQNFVDLTSAQTIGGVKTFSSSIISNSVTIGKGAGQGNDNTAVGNNALGTGTGERNTAVGSNAMSNFTGTSFKNNTSMGYNNLSGLTTGYGNTSMGAEAMASTGTGGENTAIGNQTLRSATSSYNTVLGASAGNTITTGAGNTMIGRGADVSAATLNYATAIGYGAVATADNTMQLGNTSLTNVKTSGTITAGTVTYPNTAGTNGYVLTTNGTSAAAWAAPSGAVSGGTTSAIPKYTSATALGASSISDDGTTVSISNPVTFNNKTVAGGSAAVNAQTVAYQLVQGDNGKVITMNSASAITLTIPAGLTAGFNCMVVQYGAGTVTIAGSGVTILNRSNYTKTGGQYAIVTIVSPVANTFITGGDMQ
jgi:hypothetical protein